MKKIYLSFILMTVCGVATQGKVKLLPLFTDNMVMQQKAEVPVWGEAEAGKNITVTTSWNKQTYSTSADNQGKWYIKVHTPKAGGPYTVTVSDGEPVVLHNVLIGEVWLCGGQSNMELSVSQSQDFEKEKLDASNYPNIRLLRVRVDESTKPLDNFTAVDDGWNVCSPKSIENFSAIGYFFAKNIYKDLNVPVGIIESCLGGTPAESWISGKSLQMMPEFRQWATKLEEAPCDKKVLHQLYLKENKEWEKNVKAIDPGYQDGQPIWATTTDNTGWVDTSLPGTMTTGRLAFFDGVAWTRTTVNIPSSWGGQDLKLYMGGVDDIDITYFNGVEVGHSGSVMVAREYTIPGRLVKPGKATIGVRILDTGGDIAIYGHNGKIYIENNNGERIDLSGNWKSRIALEMSDMPLMPRDMSSDSNVPGILYNAMIHPLGNYTVKGALWYQGETNDGRAYQYRDLLKLLVNDWRSQWGYDFPFYVAQLPNYRKRETEPGESKWAEMRESQAMIQQLKNTGIATLIDIGEADNIHPKNKQEAARRLALVAEHDTYDKKVTYSGPTLQSYIIEGNAIRLTMGHTEGGLKTSDSKSLRGFSIAGFDHQFHWASASIAGNDIIVECPEVEHPLAVRYAWADNPNCNLMNGAGLPAGTFRTDDWPTATYGNK